MDSLFQLRAISGRLVKESESHCIMRVGDGELNAVMKQPPGGWQERFTKNHGSDRRSSKERLPIVERFGKPAHRTGEEALIVPRRPTVGVQPLSKAGQDFGYS